MFQRSCNDRGLGPGSEAGPRLDKRGSPRGLGQLVSFFVVVGIRMEQPCSSLVLLLSWGEQVVPSQLLCCSSGRSCLISDASLASPVQWLLLWFCVWVERCESVEERKSCVCLKLNWERQDYSRITKPHIRGHYMHSAGLYVLNNHQTTNNMYYCNPDIILTSWKGVR